MSFRRSLRRPFIFGNFPPYASRAQRQNANLLSGTSQADSPLISSILIANRGEIAMSVSDP